MHTLANEREALRILLVVLGVMVAVATVLAIINQVIVIKNRRESRKMDLERFERRRKERWQDR